MKKIFAFAAAVVLFAGIANAQLGVNVGYAPQTYTQVYTNGNNSNTTTEQMRGYFVGANYNMPVSGDLCVSVGAQFRMNTSSDTVAGNLGSIAGGSYVNKHTQALIDIPVLFNYGLKLSNNLKVSLFVGPTVSYALSGNDHTTVTTTVLGNTSTTESDNNWYGENSKAKKLDVSATVGAMATLNDIRFFAGYNMGLMNLTGADNTTMKGSNWFVGVGYAL